MKPSDKALIRNFLARENNKKLTKKETDIKAANHRIALAFKCGFKV